MSILGIGSKSLSLHGRSLPLCFLCPRSTSEPPTQLPCPTLPPWTSCGYTYDWVLQSSEALLQEVDFYFWRQEEGEGVVLQITIMMVMVLVKTFSFETKFKLY